MKKLFVTGLLLGALGTAQAQTTPADTAKAPTNPLTYYGFVDAYYGFDFNHADTNARPYFLYAHNRQNEFTVNNA
ncbi:MAG: porin, partial [Cytophagaceae bacterium]